MSKLCDMRPHLVYLHLDLCVGCVCVARPGPMRRLINFLTTHPHTQQDAAAATAASLGRIALLIAPQPAGTPS